MWCDCPGLCAANHHSSADIPRAAEPSREQLCPGIISWQAFRTTRGVSKILKYFAAKVFVSLSDVYIVSDRKTHFLHGASPWNNWKKWVHIAEIHFYLRAQDEISCICNTFLHFICQFSLLLKPFRCFGVNDENSHTVTGNKYDFLPMKKHLTASKMMFPYSLLPRWTLSEHLMMTPHLSLLNLSIFPILNAWKLPDLET